MTDEPTATTDAGIREELAAPEMRVPAFVPCHAKDLATLPICIDALRRHPQVTTISVIAARSLEPDCARLGVGFVDELKLIEPWFPVTEASGDRRWYYQMFLKLSIPFDSDLSVDRYLIVDADTVLLHSFPLIEETSGVVLHPKMVEHVTPYFAGIRSLLGHDVVYEGSHNAHFMVYRAPIVRAMFAEFARVAGRAPQDGREVLRELLQQCDRQTLSFADYESYGYYTREHFPEELSWARRRQLNVLYVAPSDRVLAALGRYYHYCSFHAYRRPDRISLRVAGSVWLALRLARDRLSRARIHVEEISVETQL